MQLSPVLSYFISHGYSFFFLWLYSPILGLGRLHETFRTISVTRSAGHLGWVISSSQGLCVSAPCDCDDGEVGGMNGFWQGKPKYSEKTCPDATLSTTNPTCQTRAAVGSQRLTASVTARPLGLNDISEMKLPLCYVK
jgi:hypothetical protein